MVPQQRPSSTTVGQVRSLWIPAEDAHLRYMDQIVGSRCWSNISKSIPSRSTKSYRFRWCNQLSSAVVHRPFTLHEDVIIINAHQMYGNRWAKIARLLKGRSNNAVKNRWNVTLKKKHSGRDALGLVTERNATSVAPQLTNEQIYSMMTDDVGRMMEGGAVPTTLSLFGPQEDRKGGEVALTAAMANLTLTGGNDRFHKGGSQA